MPSWYKGRKEAMVQNGQLDPGAQRTLLASQLKLHASSKCPLKGPTTFEFVVRYEHGTLSLLSVCLF